MARVLLTGSRNIVAFNASRNSRHTLVRTTPVPLKRVWRPLEGLGVWLPVRGDYQLVHSANRIPYTTKPWIVTFESVLPRTLGSGAERLKKLLRERLVRDNCKRIIAISDYAKNKFVSNNADWTMLGRAVEKLETIHPNVPLLATKPKARSAGEALRVVFVGNDFARKGGIVALRLAEKAAREGLLVTVHIVSALNYGPGVYTDCTDASRYEEDLKLLDLPNVVYHGKKSNREVLQLLSRSHFQLMATLDDTYGFSVIEGFSVGTPAITTNVCALPEFVRHGENGYLLSMALDRYRNWINLRLRGTPGYWDVLDKTFDDLAGQALRVLQEIFVEPERYEATSANSLARVRDFHDADKAGRMLDDIYSAALQPAT